MTDPRRLLMLGPVRSGTTAVATALRKHPEVSMARREVLVWPMLSLGLDVFLDGSGRFEDRQASVHAAFDVLTANASPPGRPVRAVKFAIENDLQLLDAVVGITQHFGREQGDCKVVLIRRDDALARFASLVLAQGSNVWNSAQELAKDRAAPRTVSADRFRQFLRNDQRMRAGFELIKERCDAFELEYEQDILDWSGIAGLLEWLGIDGTRIAPGTRKISPPPSEWIENYDELVALQRSEPSDAAATLRADVASRELEHLRPERAEFHLSHAQWLLRTGRIDEARSAAMRAMRRRETIFRPWQIRAIRMLQRVWWKLQRPAQVAAALDELREMHGRVPTILALEAVQAGLRGDVAAAADLLDQAEAADPIPALRDEIADLRRRIEAGNMRWPTR